MFKLTTKLMNMFSYFITTHFIPTNKEYHSVIIFIQYVKRTLSLYMILN